MTRKKSRKETPSKLGTRIDVKIGTQPNWQGMLKALENNGMYTYPWVAESVLPKVQFSTNPLTLQLAVLTVEDLGSSHHVPTHWVYAAALERGFRLCPSEVGPQLRLQYQDAGMLIIAMEPIKGLQDLPSILYLETNTIDGARRHCLNAIIVENITSWQRHQRFVFVC